MRGIWLTKKCKSCDTEFSTEWPRQAYCSPACRNGYGICEQCSLRFSSQTKNTSGRFCSKDCWYAYYREHGKVPKTCPICSAIFHGDSQTCSPRCGRELQRSHHPGRNTHCRECGARLPTTAKVGQQFCNHACAAKSHATHGGHVRPEGTIKAHANGYVLIKRDGAWILEHRVAMEAILGRPLDSHERVHHRNGKRDDNRPENLELWHVKKKDPAGIRTADYHCSGCRCFDG
jgi:hypothetical protein